jgi:hypothetical protein
MMSSLVHKPNQLPDPMQGGEVVAQRGKFLAKQRVAKIPLSEEDLAVVDVSLRVIQLW